MMIDLKTLDFESIEKELAAFEAEERKRLGIEEEESKHWHDPNPQRFTRDDRASTTILIGGLTVAHDQLFTAAIQGLGYKLQALDVPDLEALRLGKEFGNRGQCNPTYFTVGNLVKFLCTLRDKGMTSEEIVKKYVFLTAGACGPCRFGMYVTEYRKALRDAGFETIMVNCNPETVSTDYDTSDRLYFEPLTAEDVIELARVEQRNGTLLGVIVQFGGQTPLKLAAALEEAEIPILGTSPDAIDLAEDRERFQQHLKKPGLRQPENGIARSQEEAEAIAERIGYPVVIRPSYVLGGRAMEIVHEPQALRSNGAELKWSRYEGTAGFQSYEIHRSQSAGFTPSASTRIATIAATPSATPSSTFASADAEWASVVMGTSTPASPASLVASPCQKVDGPDSPPGPMSCFSNQSSPITVTRVASEPSS